MMKRVALLTAATAGVAQAAQVGANPIRRIVTLLQDMQKEVSAEGEKEKELYEKFECYCKGNTENLSKKAEEAAAKIEEMNAKAKADAAEKATLEAELKQHKKDRTDAKADLATATKLREKDAAEYAAAVGESQSNIDAITKAVAALEKGMGSFLQSPASATLKSLIQSSVADKLDAEDRQTVMAFLETRGDYAPSSGQIVGILKNMKDVMDKDLGGIVADEEAAVKAFAELKAAKQKEIQAATEAIESKTERVGTLAVSVVEAKAAADSATDELGDSQAFLANLSVTCKEKAKDMEERTAMRQQELVAISQAIQVLNDDDSLDVFKSSLGKPKAMLIQKSVKKANKITKVKTVLAQVKKAGNAAVSLLANAAATELKSGVKVDFGKVIKMIDDMVALLKKEGADDEKHRDWCNSEFDTSDDEEKDLNRKIEQLTSSISEMSDEISGLKDEIAGHEQDIANLDKSVAEATETRKEEHSEYTAKLELNDAALKLLFKAKNILAKFYTPETYVAPEPKTQEEIEAEKEKERKEEMASWGFLQIKSEAGQLPPPPETYGAFEKKSGANNSVVALMDMLSKELEKETQEAEHMEKTAQKEYQELLADAQKSKEAAAKSIVEKKDVKATIEGRLEEAKTNKIVASDQLDTLKNYIADLHQSCDFILNNFEMRREARGNEIDGLNNAKAVLSGAGYQ